MSIYNHNKVWDEITYAFPNFDGEVCEWISNFIPRFTGHVIIYAGIQVKGAPGIDSATHSGTGCQNAA